jgi:hypothetical protein
LSDVFSSHFRRGSGTAQARTVFTNRVDETKIFATFSAAHNEWAATIDPVSPDFPRRNVLNFFGLGGIGKSTLLHKLQDSITSTKDAPAATVLIDFQEPTSFSMEDFVLRLRMTAGQLGQPCSAFDLAFAFYWSVVHPGTPLSTYTRNNSVLHRASEKVRITEEMEKALTEVASTITSASAMATAGSHLVRLVAKMIREGHRTRHAIQNCPILPMFLDPDTVVESLTFMPALLAWDIARAGRHQFAVFLDTYEEVTNRGRQVERVVQRMCYLLPNAMFVIAGRNRLDWDHADLRGALDYVGPDCWPDLSGRADLPENSCVLVGELSRRDSDEYLQQRLQINGAAAIPLPVRERIVAASHGWPLHLDMAAAYFQELVANGDYDPATFDRPFPSLVLRLISDLTPSERAVLFAAALFDSFDADLVRVVAGDVSDATVQSVISRPFVRRENGSFCPYSLHVTLRQVLRADTSYWSATDWRIAATRAFDELGRRAASRPDRLALYGMLLQGLHLSHEFDLPVQWLSAAGRALARQGGLDAASLDGITDSAAANLSCLLGVVARRGKMPFRSWARALNECGQAGLSETDLTWARALEADALLSSGHSAEATRIYSEVLASPHAPAEVAADARTMFALTLLKRSAFADLARLAASDPSAMASARLLGDVYRSNARWPESSDQYRLGLSQAEAEEDRGLAALFRAELALIEGWTAQADPRHWANLDADELEPWTRSMHLLARALYDATADPAGSVAFIEQTERVAADFEMNDVVLDALVVRAFVAAAHKQTKRLLDVQDSFIKAIGDQPEYLHWREVVGWWAGEPARPSAVQWLDGPEAARARWLRTLSTRQLS